MCYNEYSNKLLILANLRPVFWKPHIDEELTRVQVSRDGLRSNTTTIGKSPWRHSHRGSSYTHVEHTTV